MTGINAVPNQSTHCNAAGAGHGRCARGTTSSRRLIDEEAGAGGAHFEGGRTWTDLGGAVVKHRETHFRRLHTLTRAMSHHRSRKADDIELLSTSAPAAALAAVEAPPPQSGDANDEEIFSLSDLMKIAIVPATVPAAVLLVALAIAFGLGELSVPVRSFFEQIAGGALLLTYIKEIFPMLMERLDVHVKALGPTTAATRRAKLWRWAGLVLVVVGTTLLSACAGRVRRLSGMLHNNRRCGGTVNTTSSATDPVHAGSVACTGTGKRGRSTDDDSAEFTQGDTLPYFSASLSMAWCWLTMIIRWNAIGKLVKTMVLSCVLAVDNFLDGFGLAPVLQEAFGDSWWLVMLAFAGCVELGAVSTALLRYLVSSTSYLHLIWFGFATLSILDGAMELAQSGLTVYVAVGMALTWLFLAMGDMAGDEEEEVLVGDDGTTVSVGGDATTTPVSPEGPGE